ncbi:MAG: PocR ligand-binding domain-containing protein [Syntrophotaleaceae bacterium]
MNKVHFRKLVDVDRLQELLEDLYHLTGVASAVLDVDENVLTAIGWQEVCTRFHRHHPETLERCRKSDAYIKTHLGKCPEGYVDYRCRNGLWDVAMPIFIEGKHLATFFTGQFFYEEDPPDIDFFKAQAEQFGFDQTEYVKAVRQVPVHSREYIRNFMTYCRGLVRLIGETGLKNLRLMEEVEKREKTEKEAAFFRFIVENAQDPVYVLDPAEGFRMYYANPAACAHYGWDLETLRKMRIPDWDPVFDMARIPEMRENLKENEMVRFETLHRVASGELVPVEVTSTYLEYEGRELAIGHFYDIRERKAMEAALQESQHRMIEAQRIAKVGNWSWDLCGRLLSASQECLRILGTSPKTFPETEAELIDRICPEDRPRVKAAFRRLGVEKKAIAIEYRLLCPKGQEIVIREQREMACDEQGGPSEFFGTIQDITEQVRMAEALREKDLLLLQQSRMAAMGEMISYITHQWRQPLQLISLLMQHLETEQQLGKVDEQSLSRAVQQILDLVEHMAVTLDDFRDFFRTDKRREPFDLKEAIGKILRFSAADMSLHQIEVVFDAPEGMAALGYGNEFSHVMLNILYNARDALVANRSENRRIRVGLRREGVRKAITIRDNAGGIPETVREKLFEPYFTTKKNGTGIGLYISKIIVEKRFNGTLSARNVKDGAEFRIEI